LLYSIMLYTIAILPMLAFVVLYIREWPHIRRTAESYQLLLFISLLLLISVNGLLVNVFGMDLDLARIFSRVLSILAGFTLWYFTYALLRYQVIPRYKRDKLRKRMKDQG